MIPNSMKFLFDDCNLFFFFRIPVLIQHQGHLQVDFF